MIDLNKCEGWQKRDKDGIVMPWYTHPALDKIQSWDLSRKRVFEYGIGQSTIWWASKCEFLYGVDTSEDWVKAIHDKVISNTIVALINSKILYIHSIVAMKNPDIVVVDGDHRDECVTAAIQNLNTGGKLIVDNWDQPSVWVPNDYTRRKIAAIPHVIYKQPNHPDWQTLIATIP